MAGNGKPEKQTSKACDCSQKEKFVKHFPNVINNSHKRKDI